jgi:hypothetical protein
MKYTLIELLVDTDLSEEQYNDLIADISDMIAERCDGFTVAKYKIIDENDCKIQTTTEIDT